MLFVRRRDNSSPVPSWPRYKPWIGLWTPIADHGGPPSVYNIVHRYISRDDRYCNSGSIFKTDICFFMKILKLRSIANALANVYMYIVKMSTCFWFEWFFVYKSELKSPMVMVLVLRNNATLTLIHNILSNVRICVRIVTVYRKII